MLNLFKENREQRRFVNVECGIRNVELVGFADYIIMNYSIKIIIQCSIALLTMHLGEACTVG